jgi:hypothetical protein
MRRRENEEVDEYCIHPAASPELQGSSCPEHEKISGYC